MASVKTMKGKTQPQPSLMSHDHSLGNQAQSLEFVVTSHAVKTLNDHSLGNQAQSLTSLLLLAMLSKL